MSNVSENRWNAAAFCPVLFLLAAHLASGCSPGRKEVQKTIPPFVIALLPFGNQSNDVEASRKVRIALFDEMRSRGFRLVELDGIDASLKELEISDGGQLGSVVLEKIREKISADLFCYGTVIEFGFKSAVALSQRKVEIQLKFADGRSGQWVWEGQEVGVTSRAGTEAAGELAVQTAGKVVKSMKEGAKKLLPGKTLKKAADLTDPVADIDLQAEIRQAIRKLLNRFSNWNG